MNKMFYLGLDPGLSEVGFGVVEVIDDSPAFVDCGIIRTPATLPLEARLCMIQNDLLEILLARPYAAAGVEELFFVKNISNGIKVAHARGVIVAELHRRKLPIFELKPSEVKSNICGSGQADKGQVKLMVQRLLNLSTPPSPHDAADALAMAILAARLHKR